MSAFKHLGSLVQASLFGGTYEDVAFEVRVLKGEVARLHARLDKEMDRLHARLDELDGKPSKSKGKGRLRIMSAAEAADAPPETQEAAPPTRPIDLAPVQSGGLAETALEPAPATPPLFVGSMTIAQAFGAHPAAPQVFASHHLPGCLDCPLSPSETLEAGARLHSLDAARLLADLNRLAEA